MGTDGEVLLAAVLDDLNEQVAAFMADNSRQRSNPMRSSS
jgi:hypothetical protein